MPWYRYSAVGRDGHPLNSVVEAASEDEAHRYLAALGLERVHLERVALTA